MLGRSIRVLGSSRRALGNQKRALVRSRRVLGSPTSRALGSSRRVPGLFPARQPRVPELAKCSGLYGNLAQKGALKDQPQCLVATVMRHTRVVCLMARALCPAPLPCTEEATLGGEVSRNQGRSRVPPNCLLHGRCSALVDRLVCASRPGTGAIAELPRWYVRAAYRTASGPIAERGGGELDVRRIRRGARTAPVGRRCQSLSAADQPAAHGAGRGVRCAAARVRTGGAALVRRIRRTAGGEGHLRARRCQLRRRRGALDARHARRVIATLARYI